MESIFDTRGAIFEPEQVRALKDAFDAAIVQLGPGTTANTERKLGKVVINRARRVLSEGGAVDATAIGSEAIAFIAQLRSSKWLL